MAARVQAAYLLRGNRDSSVFIRGGLATSELLPGVSDVDLAIVTPDHPSAVEARDRWQRLRRRLPWIECLIDWPRIYSAGELASLAGSDAYTYGLDDSPAERDAAGYDDGEPNLDRLRALERPGLYGATADWLHLCGPDRRPPDPEWDPQARRIAAWLELLYFWRQAFPAFVEPRSGYVPLLCVKLIAEPARILLWLERGERASSRANALRLALARLPEEEEALRMALELEGRLSRSPDPPLSNVLAALIRFSSRVTGLIASEVSDRGTTRVRLAGADSGEQRALPLADWRNLVSSRLIDESFSPSPEAPSPESIAALARSSSDGPYRALRADDLIILPASQLSRTRLRALKSPLIDPAVFALAAGEHVAEFSDVRGWSARDTARRAVAEHRARLQWLDPNGLGVGDLLGAARAAFFLASINDDDPELCLTAAETARRLGAESRTEVDRLVRELPSYSYS